MSHHSLRRHLEFECGVEPGFRCAYCAFVARYADNVQRHWKTSHRDKPFQWLQQITDDSRKLLVKKQEEDESVKVECVKDERISDECIKDESISDECVKDETISDESVED